MLQQVEVEVLGPAEDRGLELLETTVAGSSTIRLTQGSRTAGSVTVASISTNIR